MYPKYMKFQIVHIISIACIVGFVGDICLQLGINKLNLGGPSGWGLKEYFKQHGVNESPFIAGGMMTLFYIFYYYSYLPINFISLSLYGIILDYIFRTTMLFPSLTGYYKYFNYFWSAVWGAIPLVLPLLIYKIITII